MDQNQKANVLFFDGVCGLCSHAVDFFMKRDIQGKIKYSPLQSDYAAKHLPKEALECNDDGSFKSLVLLSNTKFYTESSAVLECLRLLGGLWPLLYAFIIVPPFIRNFFYRVVAANRYKIFGKKDSCRLPTPAERDRFILDIS